MPKPITTDIERKVFELVDIKMSDEGNGGFSGHASMFGNVDRAGEIVAKGAFAKTIDAFVRDGFVALNHDWRSTPIGFITSAKEDDRGLLVEIAFHGTPAAQEARRVAAERHEAGKSVALSIGYRVKADEQSDKGRVLKELELFEVSLVNVPANPRALVAAVKGAGDEEADLAPAPTPEPSPAPPPPAAGIKGIFEDAVAERLRDPWTLFSLLMSCWYDIQRARRKPDATAEESAALVEEALAEFVARMREAMIYVLENPAARDEYGYWAAPADGVEFKQMVEEKLGAGADLGFFDHTRALGAGVRGSKEAIESVVKAIADYANRFDRQLERRQKDGRTISSATDGELEGCEACLDEIEAHAADAKARVQKLRGMAKPADKGTSGPTPATPELASDGAKIARELFASFQETCARLNGVAT
jgi:HK97 family phage prohead protease